MARMVITLAITGKYYVRHVRPTLGCKPSLEVFTKSHEPPN